MPSSNSNLLHVLTKSLFMSYSFFSSDNKLCWDNGSKHSSPNVSVFLFSLSVWPPSSPWLPYSLQELFPVALFL